MGSLYAGRHKEPSTVSLRTFTAFPLHNCEETAASGLPQTRTYKLPGLLDHFQTFCWAPRTVSRMGRVSHGTSTASRPLPAPRRLQTR